jgi:hypothetical protein
MHELNVFYELEMLLARAPITLLVTSNQLELV